MIPGVCWTRTAEGGDWFRPSSRTTSGFRVHSYVGARGLV